MENRMDMPRYNPDYQVTVSNILIRGKHDEMSLLEAKLIRLMVMQVVKEDTDLKTYRCRIVDLSKFLNIAPETMYRSLFELCDSLSDKRIYLMKGKGEEMYSNPWKKFRWVDVAEYDGNGVLTLKLSEGLKPYLLELNRKFTQYQFCEILSLSSLYAIRFYELICSFCDLILKSEENKPFTFTIDYLRTFFNCQEKYPNNGNFLIRVISSAVEEINQKTNMSVSYERIKDGRKIVAISVKITTNIKVLFGRINDAKSGEGK